MRTVRIFRPALTVGFVLTTGLLLSSGASVGYVALRCAGQQITLQRLSKVGDKTRNEVKVSLTIQDQPVKIVQTFEATVLKIEGDSLVSQTKDLTLEVDGQSAPIGDRPARAVKRTLRGIWLEDVTLDRDAGSSRLTLLITPLLPDKPIKPGDSWSYKYEPAKTPNSIAAEIKSSFVGVEKVDGVDAAKIKFEAKELSGEKPASAGGQAWLRLSDGVQIKLVAKAENVVLAGLPEPVTLSFEQRILP